MAEYGSDSRTLSCEECFLAEGKMCILKNGANMIRITGSSNTGHGLCCKSDATGGNCEETATNNMICSQPSGTS